jgi:hypothetical protein
MPKSRNGRRFLTVTVLAVVLVGGWLYVVRPHINNNGGEEVAVEVESPLDDTANTEDESAVAQPGSESEGSEVAGVGELPQTGGSGVWIGLDLLAGGATYLVFLGAGALKAKKADRVT